MKKYCILGARIQSKQLSFEYISTVVSSCISYNRNKRRFTNTKVPEGKLSLNRYTFSTNRRELTQFNLQRERDGFICKLKRFYIVCSGLDKQKLSKILEQRET